LRTFSVCLQSFPFPFGPNLSRSYPRQLKSLHNQYIETVNFLSVLSKLSSERSSKNLLLPVQCYYTQKEI
jgi:uncharacterized protein YbgA (DUF1722 family)